jgi:RNA polymerase sigma-70 factor (ECF subfamily)
VVDFLLPPCKVLGGQAKDRKEETMERDLIAQAAAGSVDAFTELIWPRQASLRAFCARIAPSVDDADDLAQEALVAAFQSLGSFDASRGFDPWLRGIARNKARMLWRRAAVERDVLQELLLREAERRTALTQDGPDDLLEALRRCVRTLGEGSKELLELHYCRRVPGKEMAAALRMSVGAVYTALSRLRQALRKCVGERLGGEWA